MIRFIFASVLLVSFACQGQTPTVQNISTTAFHAILGKEDMIILDVRTPEEVEEGLIKGAKHINFYDNDFEQKVSILPKDKAIYVYCRSGGRSMQAASELIRLGYKEVYNIEGGIMAWNANHFPTTSLAKEQR